MVHSRAAALIGLLAFSWATSAAVAPPQEPRFERRLYGIEVRDAEGLAYDHPFLGGLNIPRPHLVDIDADGDLDLFVQEYSGEIMLFENTGSAQQPSYRWVTDDYEGLDVGEWYHFADVDGDGAFDLLAEQRFSLIRFWRNDGAPGTPAFELVTESLLDTRGAAIFSDRQNIPKVGDIDCDGRLDLMLGRLEGTITRYEAEGNDEFGAPQFRHVTDRFQDIEIIGQVIGAAPTLHGANTMALEDIDGDGDLDLFWGDFFEPGLLFIENTGSCSTPSLRSEPEPFPLNGPIATSGYNAPAFGDLDGDGDQDLLVGVLGGAYNPNSSTIDNLWELEQTGAHGFEVATRRYVGNIDVGSETFPAFADLDGDGDLDLLIGNKIEPDDNTTGKLFHFENTGSASEPVFRLRGTLPEFAGEYHFSPAFGDLDGDGDLDILMGTWRDAMSLVINEGSATAPQWNIVDDAAVTLTRGRNATPTLGDMDGDGDLDLFIGESSGDLNYYRNEGSAQSPDWVLVDDKFQGIDGGRRSVPTLVDIEGDGDLDLVLGSEANGLMLYRNQGSAEEMELVADASFSVDVHPFAAPAFADIDDDGDADLFVGVIGGGLMYFENAR